MAGITDQVKWRGVVKVYPAIADLDAIEQCVPLLYLVDAVAGVCTIDSGEVTAGKLWVLTHIVAYNNEGTAGRIYIARLINATVLVINQKLTLAQYESVGFQGILVMNEGEKIRAYFSGCAGATDNCRLYLHGYQISKY